MTQEKPNSRLRALVANALGCEAADIHVTSGLGKQEGWDSLGHISIMSAIAEEFGLEITPELVQRLRTIRDIESELKQNGFL